MRRWIVFGCGAMFLGAAAWHFGKPAAPPVAPTPVVVAVAPAEPPKESPAKIAEVIDLARAYEPVPEETLPRGVDPASFIQPQDPPAEIPPASDLDNPFGDVIRTVREAPRGWCFWDTREYERIGLAPREVPPCVVKTTVHAPAETLGVKPREVK